MAKSSVAPSALIGTHGNWRTWQIEEKNESVCYMILSTRTVKDQKFSRQAAHLIITHRPSEGSTDVVSYNGGYVYKAGSEVTAQIGQEKFTLFTDKDTAWARETRTDHNLVKAMRTSPSAIFSGIMNSKIVKTVSDNLHLKGFEEAYHEISKACDVPVEKLAIKPPATKKPITKKTNINHGHYPVSR
jgi:hypothetical protein